jgi:hypothetical protein
MFAWQCLLLVRSWEQERQENLATPPHTIDVNWGLIWQVLLTLHRQNSHVTHPPASQKCNYSALQHIQEKVTLNCLFPYYESHMLGKSYENYIIAQTHVNFKKSDQLILGTGPGVLSYI